MVWAIEVLVLRSQALGKLCDGIFAWLIHGGFYTRLGPDRHSRLHSEYIHSSKRNTWHHNSKDGYAHITAEYCF